jgi:hypothetical protein
LGADLRTNPVLAIHRLGDVVGVQFADEEEVALFIPGSGDVLLCTAAQWHSLKDVPVGGDIGLLIDPPSSVSKDDAASTGDLKSTLLTLGALLT